MAKRNSLKLGNRDIELLSALDRCVLTAEQMATLSESFVRPFSHVGFARRRLRQLAHAGYVRAFPYALASDGRSPNYFRLTRTGWQTLHAPYGTVLRKAAPDCPRPPVARTFDWTSIVIAVVRQALNCLKFLKALVVPQACGSVPEE
jgi:hypothetical protein